MKESVVIINNEKCMELNKHVYCENIEMKSIPESLSRFFDINLILRKGIINPAHKIEVIKTNDLRHIQKSVDGINKILWAVSFLILAQLAMGIKTAIFG